jgi:outer membrane protein assembly factor BamB
MGRTSTASLLILLFTAGLAGRTDDVRSPPKATVFKDGGRSARFEIDHDAGRVLRRDSGVTSWSTHLGGYLGSVRPPHLVWDAHRVFVTHKDGVTALDAVTGRILWHASGPGNCMLLSGGLLLATDGVTVVALGTATGADIFKVRLPMENFDPLPIQEVAGLFLVQKGELPGGAGDCLLLDRHGKVRHRFDRQVVAGTQEGDDRVFLSSRDVVRLGPDKETRWKVRFEHHQWIAGGGLVRLPKGELLAFRYGCICDSGVDLIRLDGSGKVVWQGRCAGLGVGHSKYEHKARVAVEGNHLRVTSVGSYGTFVEVLDLGLGKLLKRTRSEP